MEDGRSFVGLALGAEALGQGEVVFNTAMTGYQEVLTDPSYAGQMVCMTYPLQGNYGVREADAESARPWARALIVRWACPMPSHHSSEASLDEYLTRWSVPAITEIDTRALTLHIRKHGARRSSGAGSPRPGQDPAVRHMPRSPDHWPRRGRDHVATAVRPPRRQPPRQGPRHRAGAHHQPEPRVPGRRGFAPDR